MYIICYHENTIRTYETANNLDTFRQEHPSAKIEFMFTQNNNIADITQNPSFVTWANVYGLHGVSPMQKYKNKHGDDCVIIDIRPRNPKYPVIIFNETRQKQFKCSVKSIREQLGINA